MSGTVAVVSDPGRVGALVSAASGLPGEFAVVAVGNREVAATAVSLGVDRVRWLRCSDEVPLGAVAAQVARAVTGDCPNLVLAASAATDRPIVGAIAAALRAPIVTGVAAVNASEAGFTLSRTALRGRVQQTVESSGPIVAVLEVADGGRREPAVEVEVADGSPLRLPAEVSVEETRVDSHGASDITRARRIVAVGRGLSSDDDLTLAKDLSTRLDAGLGCSMPLPHERGWLSPSQCIGATGRHVAPDLYLALGISGQYEHAVGARGARLVVVVNKDPAAPYFRESDIGIVADLRDFLPALLEALDRS